MLLEAGGERAEVEQVAAHVARLIRHEGYAPEDIAIVWRDVQAAAALTEQVLGGLRDPVRDDPDACRSATRRSAAG